MATYYVEKVGAAIYSDTNGWPSDNAGTRVERANLQAMNTAASAGDVIILSGGAVGGTGISYTGTELDADSGLTISKALTLRGCKNGDLKYLSHVGQVTLDADGAAVDALTCNTVVGYTIENLKVGNCDVTNNYFSIRETTSGTFNDVELFGSKRGINLTAASIHNRCIFTHNMTSGDYLFYLMKGTFNFCIFKDFKFFTNTDANNAEFNHCMAVNFIEGLNNDSTGTWTINNSQILNNFANNLDVYPLKSAAGIINVNNSLILPNALALGNLSSGTVNFNGDCIYKSPEWLAPRRDGIVIIGCDDTANIEYYRDTIAPKLEAYGWYGTVAITPEPGLDYSDLILLKTNGHDVACHGYKLSDDIPDMLGITINYTGAGLTATVTISANILTLKVDGLSVADIDLTATATDRLSELVTAIKAADAGFNNAGTDKTNGDASTGWCQYLADCGETDVKDLTVAFDYDSAKVYAGEVVASKALIESGLGSSITSFVCPGNSTDAGLRAALLAAGFTGSRGDNGVVFSMESIDIFDIKTSGAFSLCGDDANPSQADVDSRVDSRIEHLKYVGGVSFIYAHSLAEMTSAGWDKILAAVFKSGIRVMTLAAAVEYITDNGTDSGDHMIYTRDYSVTDVTNPNYRLKSSSPCRDAGVAVAGLTTDFEGKPVPMGSAPDIGAYEFPVPSPMGLTPGLGMGGRMIPPRRRCR